MRTVVNGKRLTAVANMAKNNIRAGFVSDHPESRPE